MILKCVVFFNGERGGAIIPPAVYLEWGLGVAMFTTFGLCCFLLTFEKRFKMSKFKDTLSTSRKKTFATI